MLCDNVQTLRSATTTQLSEPFASTEFAMSAIPVLLRPPATDSNSLGTFKSRLKSFLFSRYNWYTLPAASASEYDPMVLYKSMIITIIIIFYFLAPQY